MLRVYSGSEIPCFESATSLPMHTLIIGEEPLLLAEAEQAVLDAHKTRWSMDGLTAYRIDTVEALIEMTSQLRNASLFQEPVLFMRFSAELFQQSHASKWFDRLPAFLAQQTSVIVITGLSLANAKKFGVINCLDANSLVLNCTLPSNRSLSTWMMRRAAQQGARLSPEAAQYLAQQVHTHLIGVGHCITVLSLARHGRTITLDEVKTLWQQTALPHLGQFLNHTLQGNRIALMQISFFCLHQKSVHYLLAGLERLMVALWELQQLPTGSGDALSEWARRNRIWPYQKKLYVSAAQRISILQLERGMTALTAAIDALFRSFDTEMIACQLERIWWNCFATKLG